MPDKSGWPHNRHEVRSKRDLRHWTTDVTALLPSGRAVVLGMCPRIGGNSDEASGPWVGTCE